MMHNKSDPFCAWTGLYLYFSIGLDLRMGTLQGQTLQKVSNTKGVSNNSYMLEGLGWICAQVGKDVSRKTFHCPCRLTNYEI